MSEISVEAYIPYDLRERLAEQIKVIDKMMTDAVAAERERCAKLCEDMADRHVVTEVSKRDALHEAAATIRKGK